MADRPKIAAITTIWPPLGDKLLAPEADCTVTTFTTTDLDCCLIDEHAPIMNCHGPSIQWPRRLHHAFLIHPEELPGPLKRQFNLISEQADRPSCI